MIGDPIGLRIAVACSEISYAGGLFRFERFGRTVRPWGHDAAYVTMGDLSRKPRPTNLNVLTYAEAAGEHWDAVMVPGAGFPDSVIRRFVGLKDPRFGVRIQHVLNDPSRRENFLAVNRVFEPDRLVLNNRHWPPGSLDDFQASSVHLLEGAVDVEQFLPRKDREPFRAGRRLLVGGLANKNATSVIEAAVAVGADVRLFGIDDGLAISHAAMISSGRLTLLGPLDDNQLADFYARVDVVVHAEPFAGWANLAAEAMASGTPLICTRHGTLAFAEDGITAIVIADASAASIRAGLERLLANPNGVATLTEAGRTRILSYDWKTYSRALLDLCQAPANGHLTKPFAAANPAEGL